MCCSTKIIYLGHTMREILLLANLSTKDIVEMIPFKGLVSLRYIDECV
jgi:hypothetical protein